MAHGAAEPGIGPGLRRPDPLDQAAEDNAIDVLQARLERTIDANAHTRDLPPPRHAIGDRDLEQLGIVRRRDGKVGCATRNVIECLVQFHTIITFEGNGLAVLVPAQGGDYFAVPCGELGEGLRCAG